MLPLIGRYRREIFGTENVIAPLVNWQLQGMRTAIVTLVAIEGSSPRPLGAQMAVVEDGSYAGYLSGGCFEKAVAAEAVRAISEGRNRSIRYGKDSRYIDIKLPCGSGLDLYFDQNVPDDIFRRADAMLADRKAVCISTKLSSGEKDLSVISSGADVGCERDDDLFRSVYLPPLRVLVAGTGTSFAAVAKLFAACGLLVSCITNDSDAAMELLEYGVPSHRSVTESIVATCALDAYSAVVLVFHDHEQELPVLAYALESDCFYIGALGSLKTSLARRALLEARGYNRREISRIRAPIGLIAKAKCQLATAAGILAELVLEAKMQKLIS
jgi:xanthine dehydrogenase accessory factor